MHIVHAISARCTHRSRPNRNSWRVHGVSSRCAYCAFGTGTSCSIQPRKPCVHAALHSVRTRCVLRAAHRTDVRGIKVCAYRARFLCMRCRFEVTGCADLGAVRTGITPRARCVAFGTHSVSSLGVTSCVFDCVSKRVHDVSSPVRITCRFRALPRAYLKDF